MEEETQHEQSTLSEKITPMQLREQYGLNIANLAHKAKIGPTTVYYLVMGYPVAKKYAEQILATISAETGQTYTLENVEVALLSKEQEQRDQTHKAKASEAEKMHIAVLAWGSLIWEPRNLALASAWKLGGPEVPLEFSRVSLSRSGALTLVIDAIHGILHPTYVAMNVFQTLDEARENVGEREGCGPGCVGYVNCHDQTWYSRQLPSIVGSIADWGKNNGFGAVIWTDLDSNFGTIDKTQFSDIDERVMPFTVEHAKRYLHGLRAPGDALARAYINKAPAHIQTPLRRCLASDPWLVVSSQEEERFPAAGTTDASTV